MKEEDKLLEKFGRKGCWKVPDGYFEAFPGKMLEKLPEVPARPRPQPASVWTRVRPYLYLAAMFAGIWMMMKIFHDFTGDSRLNLDNPPENIAMIMEDETMFREMEASHAANFISDTELEDEVSGNYSSIEEFEADFGYEIEPEYEDVGSEE